MKKSIPSIGMLLILATAHNLKGQAVSAVFDPSATGDQAWATLSNWAPQTVPAASTSWVTIDRSGSLGDLNLTTPSTPLNISSMTLTAGANSALNLFLDNNVTLSNLHKASVFTNNISASKMTFDLNGYDFVTSGSTIGPYVRSTGPTGLQYFTVKDSSAGGGGMIVFGLYNQTGGNVLIENNVTLKINSNGAQTTVGTAYTSFSSGSTLKIDLNNGASTQPFISALSGGVNSALGNLTVGDATNGRVTSITFRGDSSHRSLVVRGSMLIGVGSDITFGDINSGSTTSIAVGGDFTDQGSAVTTYQGTGANATISLNGGSGTVHTLSINRSLNTNGGKVTNFQIGDGTTPGNIRLVNAASNTVAALTTTGGVKVFANSRLDLGTSTDSNSASLIAAGINIESGATIATMLGSHAGFASTSGALTLNTFNLQLNYDGSGWTNGSSLEIFNYGTHAPGLTPTITDVAAGWDINWGSLQDDGDGHIYLNNISVTAVPEPSTALLMGVFGGLVIWTVRRKSAKV